MFVILNDYQLYLNKMVIKISIKTLKYICGLVFVYVYVCVCVCVCVCIYIYIYIYISEKAMAPHSSVLAWRIPGTGEPGVLPSLGSHRVGHD